MRIKDNLNNKKIKYEYVSKKGYGFELDNPIQVAKVNDIYWLLKNIYLKNSCGKIIDYDRRSMKSSLYRGLVDNFEVLFEIKNGSELEYKLYDLFFCAYPKLEDERTETGYILENFNKDIEIPNEFQLIDKQIINGQNKINCKERNMKIHKPFGLDLGTTNSTISIFKDGKNIYAEDGKEKTIPSIVAHNGNHFVVGKSAKNNTSLNEKIKSIKRDMGKEGDYVTLNGKKYRPEEISAEIIRHCVNLLNTQIKDGAIYDRAVITVPAYFNIAQKNATVKAGELAGVNVLMLLEEPTSAAIKYCVQNGIENGVFMVYDLGGGTFDVSIIEKIDNIPIVLATAGNNFLGGNNFDEILAHYMIDVLNSQLGYDIKLDLEKNDKDKKKFENLVLCCENIKKSLSIQDNMSICRYDVFQDNSNVDLIIDNFTREQFENLIKDKIATDTIVECEKALKIFKDSGRTLNEIDNILLVGGSSHMPIVKNTIEDKYVKTGLIKKVEVFEPDLAVGSGAGIISATLPILIEDDNFEIEIDMPYIFENETSFSGRLLKGNIKKFGVIYEGKEYLQDIGENQNFNLTIDSKVTNAEYVLYNQNNEKIVISEKIESQNLISPTPVQNETIRIEIADLEKNEIINFPIVNQGESLPCEATHNFKINEYSKNNIILPVKEGYREIYKLIAKVPQNTRIGSRVSVNVKIDTLGNVKLKMFLDGEELESQVVMTELSDINQKSIKKLDGLFDIRLSSVKKETDKEKYLETHERLKRELSEAEKNNDKNHYSDVVEKYKSLIQEMPTEIETYTIDDFDNIENEIKDCVKEGEIDDFDIAKVENYSYFGKRAVRRGDMQSAKTNYDALEEALGVAELRSSPVNEFTLLIQAILQTEKAVNLIQDENLKSAIMHEYDNVLNYLDSLKISMSDLQNLSNKEIREYTNKIRDRAIPLFRLLTSSNVEEINDQYSKFEGRLSKD